MAAHPGRDGQCLSFNLSVLDGFQERPLMTDHPGMNLVDVYTSVLHGFTHEPTLHVHYGNKTVSMKDGLPKFKDLPADFGGSDETLPE